MSIGLPKPLERERDTELAQQAVSPIYRRGTQTNHVHPATKALLQLAISEHRDMHLHLWHKIPTRQLREDACVQLVGLSRQRTHSLRLTARCPPERLPRWDSFPGSPPNAGEEADGRRTGQPICSARATMMPAAAEIAEPVAVLVLRHLAEEFRAVGAQTGVDVVDGDTLLNFTPVTAGRSGSGTTTTPTMSRISVTSSSRSS